MAFFNEIIAILNGLTALVVIFYSMTAELLVTLSVVGDLLPKILYIIPLGIALVVAFFSNFFFGIPGLAAMLLGVAGTPFSWPDLISGLFDAFWGPGKTFVDFLVGTFTFFIANLKNTGAQTNVILPEQQTTRNDRESWVFINGIATTEEVAMANTRLMYKMFGRPVTTAYNPANGMIVDLVECMMWKCGAFDFCNKSARKPRDNLIEVLKKELIKEEKKTVVLLAHSQGTIITGNAIEKLSEDVQFAALMKEKLEVYTFANCAHVMSSNKVRYLENIYNRRDTVAWIGQLYPFPQFWKDDQLKPIRISGVAVEESTQWGHLLNTHYLLPMSRPTIFGKRRFATSNLWKYCDGVYDAKSTPKVDSKPELTQQLKKVE